MTRSNGVEQAAQLLNLSNSTQPLQQDSASAAASRSPATSYTKISR
ncbi:hypothetical protein [Anabaenopsis arnoldii]